HSSFEHLDALIDASKDAGVPVKVAAFLDGRDVPPRSAAKYLERLEIKLGTHGNASISMISGRYYAMDRDQRWERTKLAYDALVNAKALNADSAHAALEMAYSAGEDDEFVKPTIIGDIDPVVRDGDACLFFNFRPDRARQLTRAFSDPSFSEFPVKRFNDFVFAIMTLYDASFENPLMFGK